MRLTCIPSYQMVASAENPLGNQLSTSKNVFLNGDLMTVARVISDSGKLRMKIQVKTEQVK